MNALTVALVALIAVAALLAANLTWYGSVQAGVYDPDTIPASLRLLAAEAADRYMRGARRPSADDLRAAVEATVPAGGSLGPIAWRRTGFSVALSIGNLSSRLSICTNVTAEAGAVWEREACVYVNATLVDVTRPAPSVCSARLVYADDVGDLTKVYAVAVENVAGAYIVNQGGNLVMTVEILNASKPAVVAVGGRVFLPVIIPPH